MGSYSRNRGVRGGVGVRLAHLLALAGAVAVFGGPVPAGAQEKAAPIELVKDGKSDYVVVLAKDAGPSEKWAAKDFVDHIKKMSGAELPIREEPNRENGLPYLLTATKVVYVGNSAYLGQPGVPLGAGCGPEDFFLLAAKTNVLIVGGRPRGAMYGVYTLLEKLGCRWWYPGASTIPQMKNITIPALNEQQKPVLEYRDYLYGDIYDGEEDQLFRARNKVNGGFYKTLKPEYGGVWTFDTLVHSYERLMPADKYFDKHPEYFGLVKGKRTRHQPCFSNPEVVKIMAEALIAELGQHPEWKFVTVGQNDNNNYCQCEQCAALFRKYESGAGAQLHFAKEVAAIVRRKFPDVWINVPAYHWTRKPPKGIAPEAKSFTTLCSIECNFGQPLAEGWPRENADFKADLIGWSEVAPRLLVWDYTTNFRHYILPYPNYYVLAPNVKFLADHKVRGYMAQGSHTTRHGQFAPLCLWVLAKAMWDPNADGTKLVEEFCLGYYGPRAGKLVLEYANLLHGAIAKDRVPIWDSRKTLLSAPYLSPELMAQGDALFRRAEAAVKDDPELLKRVQADHVPVLYVLMRRAGEMFPAAAKATPDLTMAEIGKNLAEYAKAAGVNRVAEGDTAEALFQWAADYGPKKTADPAFDLPPEVRKLDGAKVYFLQAAQLDEMVKYLQKADGASDGWAQKLPNSKWSVTRQLNPPWGVREGRTYRLFIRAKATADANAGREAISACISTPPLPLTCHRVIRPAEVNGQWQVYDIGPWKAGKEGGRFLAFAGPGIREAYLDCLWLVETGDAPAATTKPAK